MPSFVLDILLSINIAAGVLVLRLAPEESLRIAGIALCVAALPRGGVAASGSCRSVCIA